VQLFIRLCEVNVLNVYHVPKQSMTSSWVTSMAMKIITIWCLQKFLHNAHPHVQPAYLINRHLILYATLARFWFLTIQELSLSKNDWVTWASGINATLSTLIFTIWSTTLFFYKSCLFHFRCVHIMSCNYCY